METTGTNKDTAGRTRKELRRTFDGSDELFAACWRRVGRHIQEGYFDDPAGVLEQTASELVNNPRSRFFIYG